MACSYHDLLKHKLLRCPRITSKVYVNSAYGVCTEFILSYELPKTIEYIMQLSK